MRVAIIPARGGSRRIPRKNIREFHGKPIIAYSIEAARAALFDQVWVSTEDQEIAEVAIAFKAHVLYRPLDLARDEVGTQEVMKNALAAMPGAEVACCIYPCAPLLRPNVLRRALELLVGDRNYIVPVGVWLSDPGQFYIGRADAFRRGVPLIGPGTCLMQIDPGTSCDINTEEDWKRADAMYAALQPHEKVMA